MRRLPDPRAARRLMQAVTVKRLAAELELARAQASLDRVIEHRRQQAAELDRRHQGWLQSVTGASIGLGMAEAWSAAVMGQQAELARVDGQVRDAETEAARRSDGWKAANARAEAAEDVARRSAARERRRRDEAALARTEDLITRRGRAP